MLLTNHTLTGVALGLFFEHPGPATVAGGVSHLAMDALPHFGFDRHRRSVKRRLAAQAKTAGPATNEAGEFTFRDPKFLVLGAADFTLSALIALAAVVIRPDRALLIAAGVLGATLPDLVYIPLIIFRRDRVEKALFFYRPMLRLLAWIQWSETRAGAITEILWAALMITVVYLLH